MTDFIGCYASDKLIPGAYYRVGLQLGAIERVLATGTADANNMRAVYDGIRNVCPLIPNMPFSYSPGDTAMVIDCTAASNAAIMTVGGAATAIDGISGFLGPVNIVSIEKLGGPPSVNAPAERAGVVAAIQSAPGPLSSITGALSGFSDDLKYMIIAAAVVAGVILLKDVAQEWG